MSGFMVVPQSVPTPVNTKLGFQFPGLSVVLLRMSFFWGVEISAPRLPLNSMGADGLDVATA